MKKFGYAFKFVNNRFKNDREFVLTAVKHMVIYLKIYLLSFVMIKILC